jgi:hypothetical protein
VTSIAYLELFGRVKVKVTFTRRIWPKWVVAQVPLPRTILVRSGYPLSVPLLAHELVHVIQWEQHGWLFALKYLWELRRGYRNNRFEIEARYLQEKPEFIRWAVDVIEGSNE